MVLLEADLVEDGGAFSEPMAKLLRVLRWPSVGGGEADPRQRTMASGEQLRCGGGCDVGAAPVRRTTAWLKWLGYGARRRHGGSSASASTAKSLRALRLRWTTASGYRLRRGGGGRRWIGCDGVADGGGWGFAAGGEGVLAPMEYEWGIGGGELGGNHVFGTRLFEIWGKLQTLPPSKISDMLRVGDRTVISRVPNIGRERFRPSRWVFRRPRCMNVFRRRLSGV